MWADESGGGAEVTGPTGTPDDLLVTVEGEEYSADVNFDSDGDGVDDTAVIEHSDGSAQAFTDFDGDGAADGYLAFDAQGHTVARAEYDETSGDWVSTGPADTGDADTGDTGSGAETQASAGGTITADLPGGDVEVGPATTDTDHDGVNDTAVLTDAEGNTVAYTDIDGDAEADVAVVIDEGGNATTYEHTGDGEWVEVDSVGVNGGDGAAEGDTGADGAGGDTLWGGGQDTVEGVARIDSMTGQWISQN